MLRCIIFTLKSNSGRGIEMSEDTKKNNKGRKSRSKAELSKATAEAGNNEMNSEAPEINQNNHDNPRPKKASAASTYSEKEAVSTADVSEQPEAGASEPADIGKKKRINYLYKSLRIVFTVGFFVFAALFINEVWLQPFLAHRASSKAKELFVMPSPTPAITAAYEPTDAPIVSDEGNVEPSPTDAPTPTPDPTRDSLGRLLIFRDLLTVNEDVKGWIKLDNLNGENDTKIDYVVMQSGEDDPEYYLTRDWQRNKVKGGSLFLDYKSSVEKPTQNLVIHGHNMTSTDDMFHYLLQFNKKEYYDSHPMIDFNTIYSTGQWKIFAVFITNGTSKKEPFFNYTRSEFTNSSDFLNFVYQLRIRSIYNAEDVDINEKDQLLTLSTCSYEVKDYRTVIVARKVREGEDPTVNTENVLLNPEPLYPDSYYYRYGGKAPKLPESFEDAMQAGMTNWYQPADE